MTSKLRIALVHDWLTSMRGGEKCIEVLCELYPDAVLYTLLHLPGSVSPTIERMDIRTSFIQKLPHAHRLYRHYLPLFPTAIERFDMSEYDVVISSSHCVAKGIRPRPDALHVCYCHTPMRYVWDMFDDYFGPDRTTVPIRTAMNIVRPYLQKWDVASSVRVTHFLANSAFVRERISRIYRREAKVIHPPVDVSRFSASTTEENFYLIVGALVPYKRVDLAIDVCNAMKRNLVIVGSGPEEETLRRRAGSTVTMVGWRNDEEIASLYQRCTALLFPGIEDFGIVPLEAMASGKPVIAYGQGGVLETVVNGETGIFFYDQTPANFSEAITRCESISFDPHRVRMHSLSFDRSVYKSAMQKFIADQIHDHFR
jgi:glycosyltransferase involved in cell wall biosynthesis